MTREEILAMTDKELDVKANHLMGRDVSERPKHNWGECEDTDLFQSTYQCRRCGELSGWVDESELDAGPCTRSTIRYSQNIGAAMTDLFPSVYGRGGKLKGGAWVLSTVDEGRDVASACLLWKAKSGHKHRVNKAKFVLDRGEMARAITLCWVCGMLGVSDE